MSYLLLPVIVVNATLAVVFGLVGVRRGCRRACHNETTPSRTVYCICPVKGAADKCQWETALASEEVQLILVIESCLDPAHELVVDFARKHARATVVVAGMTSGVSQKLHNILRGLDAIDPSALAKSLVCTLDNDVVVAEDTLPHLKSALLHNVDAFAASAFACDMPVRFWSVTDHAAAFLRLIMDASVSSGRANAAWGGCCMLHGSDVLPTSPLHQAWTDGGYSDDWLVHETATRLKRPVVNPSILLASPMRMRSWAAVYNFFHRQCFVLHMHATGRWTTPHRIMSSGLVLLMLCATTLFLTALGMQAYAYGQSDVDCLTLWMSVASSTALIGAAGGAIHAQRCLVAGCNARAGAILARHRWNPLVAIVAFPAFALLLAFATGHAALSPFIVWSRVRYRRRRGRVVDVHRLDVNKRDPLLPGSVADARRLVKDVRMPNGFVWGTTTAAGHVEGDLEDTNWARWEAQKRRLDGAATIKDDMRCGKACDAWTMTLTHDIPMMAAMGITSYRFSVEWSRVMPGPDSFDEGAIDTYASWCVALRAANIEPCVTLLHFSTPGWFEDRGGWLTRSNIDFFRRFVEAVVPRLACKIWCTLNEPVGSTINGYIVGIHPPGARYSYRKLAKVILHQHMAHAQAARVIRAHAPDASIMIASNVAIFEGPTWWGLAGVTDLFNGLWNWAWIDVAVRGRFSSICLQALARVCGVTDDLRACEGSVTHIGVNVYTRISIEWSAWEWICGWRHRRRRAEEDYKSRSVSPPHCHAAQQTRLGCCFASPHRVGYDMSDLEWDLTPTTLERVLRAVWSRWELPVYVTESGCADADAADDRAVRYLAGCVVAVQNALEAGVDVRGYHYFSLMDNFEWAEGYDARFGLSRVKPETFERVEKPRAAFYRWLIASSAGKSSDATTISTCAAVTSPVPDDEAASCDEETTSSTSASKADDWRLCPMPTTPTIVTDRPTEKSATRQLDMRTNSSKMMPPTAAMETVIVLR